MMSERRFRTWAVVATALAALLPWLILPWHLAVAMGPVIAVLATVGLVTYIVRSNRIYREK